MKAIGHVRVSSEDQAREGVSLDAQEARLRAYATAKGWTLADVVRDEGRSAKDLRRPAWSGSSPSCRAAAPARSTRSSS